MRAVVRHTLLPMAKGSGGKWLGRILLTVFLILVTAGLWVPLMITCFFEKDYSFPEVAIDATVESDGDLVLEERRTFDFKNGPFTFAYFNVEDPDQLLRDFSVSEVQPGGSERRLEWSGGYSYATEGWEARWEYPESTDEQRTFVFRYRMPCAVQRYPDKAHLYWQFIGAGWEKETEHAVVRVHLPGPATGELPKPLKPEPLAPELQGAHLGVSRGTLRVGGAGRIVAPRGGDDTSRAGRSPGLGSRALERGHRCAEPARGHHVRCAGSAAGQLPRGLDPLPECFGAA